LDELDEYIKSLSPGTLEKIESPHYMEQAVPERIAREVEMVITSVPRRPSS
jgi:hypothetical protein